MATKKTVWSLGDSATVGWMLKELPKHILKDSNGEPGNK